MKFYDIGILKFKEIYEYRELNKTFDRSQSQFVGIDGETTSQTIYGNIAVTLIEDNWYIFSKNIQKLIDTELHTMISQQHIFELLNQKDIQQAGCIIDENEYTFFMLLNNNIHITIFNVVDNNVRMKLHYMASDIGQDNMYTFTGYNEYGEESDKKINDIFNRIIFKEFIEVETITVSKDKPTQKLQSTKYINKSKIPITIIDSSWYRNIIRTEAFGVRGHFRLQPFGEGMTQRKLKWIAPYVKEGYSRTAKKELLKEEA